ncbi:DUF1853 family protein [Halomonas sp. HNIBRBA4712]|uniref:DUF1853 family protein n=1 Tax=Halomonas sp. HNIBRBA4712 TaxID=3373087 RepID=UPI0037462112
MHSLDRSPALFSPLAQRVARDLAWLVKAPDLITLKEYAGRPTLDEMGLAGEAQDGLDWLDPACQALARRRVTRMGHYHEALWHLLLDHAPNTRLLAHNVAIRERRQTLGELDMLYRTRTDPAPVHLEVAIKFYLGLAEGPDHPASPNRWIGTGGLDSLARKCAHLRAHQLPLSATPLARATLRHWLAPRDCPYETSVLTQRLAMPGVLFYPFHAALPAPTGVTDGHYRGQWCYLRDWRRLLEEAGEVSIAWLRRPFWMAPPLEAAFEAPGALWPALAACIERFGPQQVLLKGQGEKEEAGRRVILVPDEWPREVPLPIGSGE